MTIPEEGRARKRNRVEDEIRCRDVRVLQDSVQLTLYIGDGALARVEDQPVLEEDPTLDGPPDQIHLRVPDVLALVHALEPGLVKGLDADQQREAAGLTRQPDILIAPEECIGNKPAPV